VRCEGTIYASEAKRNATGARRPIMESWFDEAELPLWVAEGAVEVCAVVGGSVGVIMDVVGMLVGVGMIAEVVRLTDTEELSGSMDGNISVFVTDVAVGLPCSGKVSVTSVSVGSGLIEEVTSTVDVGA